MLIVNALAGTGKTSTVCFGLGSVVPKTMILSDEQKKIIKLMRTYEWESCAAQAFNVDIANELKERVPSSVDAATCNAFGHRAWTKHIGVSRLKVDAFKSNVLFRDVASALAYKDRVSLESTVCSLVGHCKSYLVDPVLDQDRVKWLADRFDLDFTPQILDYVQQVFKLGLDGSKVIDYNDQVFLPIYHGIKIPKFDLVVVDELQDLNVAKQEFAFRMARKYIVGVGDVHQAIYGFAGSDSDAMENFSRRMKELGTAGEELGCAGFKELPLTITRRNPVKVVEAANRYVPELKAAPNAIEGSIVNAKESTFIEAICKDVTGRMVLCRTNAPLLSTAFRLIARNRRCYIQGKDLGSGIKTSVKAFKDDSLDKAVSKACAKIDQKIADLQSKPFPDTNRIDALTDRATCIRFLSDGVDTIDAFCTRVDSLFKDKGQEGDIQLSSVHKSKGLEHPNVCILKPEILPFTKLMKRNKDGTPSFQVQQEYNLTYVAYTRSQNSLTFIADDTKRSNDMDRYGDSE